MPVKRETYTGWGRVLQATGDLVRPERLPQLGADLGPAIGGLRAYGDAALNTNGMAVDMTRLDRFIKFDEGRGTLEAEAGVMLSDILRCLAPKGWMPAVLPGTAYATLGGAIASDVHGKNHESAGTFGGHVLEIRLIGPDGVARNITLERDPDLFRATIGGMGQTGIVESATIQLNPCPSGFMEMAERRIGSLAEFITAFEQSTAQYNVGWIDAQASGERKGRGILEEAQFAGGPAPYRPRSSGPKIPFNAPRFAMSKPIVKTFNALYYRRVPENGRTKYRKLEDVFFPLDGVQNWNRFYGKRGFHQFQCVIPTDAASATLDRLMGEISWSGLASPLAVLKRLGEGRAGMMSFPMAGYTLAVDFQNSEKARDLIRRLEDMTADAGGRVYLAKDSTATPAAIEKMYPELEAYRKIVRAQDPDGVFETDLARRLNLRGAS